VKRKTPLEDSNRAEEGGAISKELEYMVKEYDVVSAENSQLRERMAELENKHQVTDEGYARQYEELSGIASMALANLKEVKFSKEISEEAVLELEKRVLELEKTIVKKDECIENLQHELDGYRQVDLKKLDKMSDSFENVFYATSDEEKE